MTINDAPTLLRLFVARGELFAELAEPGCLDGVELAAHAPIAVRSGNVIEIRGQAVRIESSVLDTRLLGARLERLPRGGRVTFVFADGERTVYLPGRRRIARAAAGFLDHHPRIEAAFSANHPWVYNRIRTLARRNEKGRERSLSRPCRSGEPVRLSRRPRPG